MPILSTKPIEQDGKVYPNLLVNISMSPLQGKTGSQSVALKLTPERQEDGVSESLPEHSKTVVILDVYQEIIKGDMVLAQAVMQVSSAIQDYVNAKGL